MRSLHKRRSAVRWVRRLLMIGSRNHSSNCRSVVFSNKNSWKRLRKRKKTRKRKQSKYMKNGVNWPFKLIDGDCTRRRKSKRLLSKKNSKKNRKRSKKSKRVNMLMTNGRPSWSGRTTYVRKNKKAIKGRDCNKKWSDKSIKKHAKKPT